MGEPLKRIVIFILTWEARLVLARFKPSVVAITGSVGKTTTKDAIYAAIADHVKVRRSEKSYNGELGVPLTILGLENAWTSPLQWLLNIARGAFALLRRDYPSWLVLEVGADRPGDIRRIASWLRPDVTVLTGVSEIPAHVEFFGSPEHVLKEKRALAEYLKPGGTLILNGDDPKMRELRAEFRGLSVTYGREASNEYYASHEHILYLDARGNPTQSGGKAAGVQFWINHAGSSMPVAVFAALGASRVYAATAAIAVAEAIGLDAVAAAAGLREWEPPPGRMRIVEGLKGSTIIDDTYNSSPAAALAALDTLAEIKAARRIAVLGDMLELGRFTRDAHRKVGERAAKVADKLITVGLRSRALADAARDAGMRDEQVLQYEHGEAERAGEELLRDLQEGDVVLVKGSQSMRLEKTVLTLMAEPSKAAELLVRMEPEWQMR